LSELFGQQHKIVIGLSSHSHGATTVLLYSISVNEQILKAILTTKRFSQIVSRRAGCLVDVLGLQNESSEQHPKIAPEINLGSQYSELLFPHQ
jgi:hypothetical protein